MATVSWNAVLSFSLRTPTYGSRQAPRPERVWLPASRRAFGPVARIAPYVWPIPDTSRSGPSLDGRAIRRTQDPVRTARRQGLWLHIV